MIAEIPNPFPDNHCFFCGTENDQGVHLHFFHDAETREVFVEYIPESRFTGQGTILHGGIQAGLLDEIMGWTGFAETGSLAVTIKLDLSYHRPIYCTGEAVRISCVLLADEGKTMSFEAKITDGTGETCTSATGKFHKISRERYDALVKRPAHGQ